MRRVVHVDVPPRPYDAVVGPAAIGDLGALVADRRQVAVVSQAAVAGYHGDAVQRAARGSGLFLIGEGEEAKSLSTVEDLCRRFAAAGLLRGDVVVALGGGVVGDTAGLAAAVYHRGIDVVQVPTTLLAQVDAAVGGKTGVNLREGKNLVGAFHHPIAVLVDVATLATLPEREYRAGLGEVAKYALMHGDGLVDLLRVRLPDVLARDAEVLTELVARCLEIKASVVAADPEERTGRRAVLNYGHTLAHALETAGAYGLLHGEAVAIGLVFASRLAVGLERLDVVEVERHHGLVSALGLPTSVPDGARAADLLALMRRDKKAHGGLTFVLRDRNGRLETVDDPPAPALEDALRAVGVET